MHGRVLTGTNVGAELCTHAHTHTPHTTHALTDEKLTCRESQSFSAWPLLIDSPVCERWLSRESNFERGRSRAALIKAATTGLFVKVQRRNNRKLQSTRRWEHAARTAFPRLPQKTSRELID